MTSSAHKRIWILVTDNSRKRLLLQDASVLILLTAQMVEPNTHLFFTSPMPPGITIEIRSIYCDWSFGDRWLSEELRRWIWSPTLRDGIDDDLSRALGFDFTHVVRCRVRTHRTTANRRSIQGGDVMERCFEGEINQNVSVLLGVE